MQFATGGNKDKGEPRSSLLLVVCSSHLWAGWESKAWTKKNQGFGYRPCDELPRAQVGVRREADPEEAPPPSWQPRVGIGPQGGV